VTACDNMNAKRHHLTMNCCHPMPSQVTAAMNEGMAYNSSKYPPGAGFPISAVLDVQAVNYQYGDTDSWHARRPNQPMFNSESAACTCARGVYTDAFTPEMVHQSAVNCLQGEGCLGGITMEGAWQATSSRRYMAGAFAWSGFDYRHGALPSLAANAPYQPTSPWSGSDHRYGAGFFNKVCT
jgi:hypothetical protein